MKTHLLTKKRALISSVAMLLVAIIALGTATFAWFTSSTTAKANGIKVQTIKSSELVISKLNKSWGTKVDYNMGQNAKTYIPVSTANGSDWFTTNAVSKKSYIANAKDPNDDQNEIINNATVVEPSKKGDYYFAEQLNVKNKGEAAVENVAINFSVDEQSDRTGYYRIALVPVNDNEDNAGAAASLPSAAENFFAEKADEAGTLQNVYGEKDTVGYQALTGTNVKTDLSKNVKPNSVLSVDVGTLTSGQAKYYNLYVWFEGQDHDCYDGLAGASIPDINFTVTGDTVSQG